MAEIHDDLSDNIAFWHASTHSYFLEPCAWLKCLPSVQAIVPHRGGSILRSILIVQLLKSHVFGQIIVNLSQFRVSCYKFDVKLKLRIFPKALCKLQNDTTIWFLVLALKRVRSFFICGVYIYAMSMDIYLLFQDVTNICWGNEVMF